MAPRWSGQFYEIEDEGVGMIQVHITDQTNPQPPAGWSWDHLDESDSGDYETHWYRRSA